MKKCTACATENEDNALSCRRCGGRFFYLPRPANREAGTSSSFRSIRSPRSALVAVGICLMTLVALGYWRQTRLNALTDQIAQEESRLIAERAGAVATADRTAKAQGQQEEQAQRARLRDPDWLSGALARRKHAHEWSLRLAHDPSFATTILETNLLMMERLGKDTTVAAQAAIARVAQLSAPAGSRVEVDPVGDGFRVRVAFLMSRLSQNEAGAVTKHHSTASMRVEIQDLSSQVLQDLYEYCGMRGITSISVTCDHTVCLVPDNATPEERKTLLESSPPVLGRLYRVSLNESAARYIADWREARPWQVTRLSTVEFDGLKTLTITPATQAFEKAYDAVGELPF